jgi:O-antigen/teichoic acid export membrane protein
MKVIKKRIIKLLRWSQKYTKTDMVYIAKGGSWLFTGKGLIALISLATTVAFANLLPVETFGTYQFVIAMIGMFSITSLPGISLALVRASAKDKDGSLLLAYKTRIKWALAGSFGILAVSIWYFLNEDSFLGIIFLVLAPLFPLFIASSSSNEYWIGKKRFDIKTVTNVLADIGIAGATIVALYLTNSVLIIASVFVGSTAFFYFLIFLYSKKRINNKEIDKDMLPLGKNLTLMGAIGQLSSHLDKIILWKVAGPAQVAIYTLSIKPFSKITGFLPISTLALPKLSEKGVRGYERKKSVLRKMMLLFAITVPISLFLIFLAPFAYKILFPQYMDSVIYFQALTFKIVLLPTGLLNDSLIAEMKTKYLYITRTVTPIIKIVLFLVLAPIFGIWGIISTLLLTSLITAVMNLYFFWKM